MIHCERIITGAAVLGVVWYILQHSGDNIEWIFPAVFLMASYFTGRAILGEQ